MLGGAGIVTYRLMKALQTLGHEVKMLVFTKLSADPDVVQVSSHPVRNINFLSERLSIFLRNGFSRKNLFKVSTGSHGLRVDRLEEVKEADAVFINWINQGTLSLKGIERLANMGKRIVWTMHDMWCMTGICHHSFGCLNFTDECGNCKFLGRKASPTDLSHKVWLKKDNLYNNTSIRFVAVSSWVKETAMTSRLLRGHDITVIPNAFPSDRFTIEYDKPVPFPLKDFKHVISFGAANLLDSVKGIQYAIEALNILYDKSPETAAGSVAIFYGRCDNPELFAELRFPHIHTGTINDPDLIHFLMSRTDVILSTSLYETLGGTLIEGMSCGAIPVTFGKGGQVDFVHHKVNGYIARYLDAADVAEGIRWAFNSNISRQSQHDYIKDRFSATSIARRYVDLISPDF